MGGRAFNLRAIPINIKRLPPVMYLELRDRCILILQAYYGNVGSPTEAPEKNDHGDIDVIVGNKLCEFSTMDLAQDLGAIDHVKNGHTTSFAIQLPEKANEFFQLDVQSCKQGLFKWEIIYNAYGDLWGIIGMFVARLGFTINDSGLHVRVAEIESTHPRDCLLQLTYRPREIMGFLGLDIDCYDLGFETLDEVYIWATASRFFRRDCFEKSKKKELVGKKAQRPMIENFIMEWLPKHLSIGVVEEDRQSQRERLIKEAVETFGKRTEYQQMVVNHKQRLMKDEMWRKIVKVLPLEGKDLGEAIKALKALLRWEDGRPVLCVEGIPDTRLPALDDDIVDSVVLPWVVTHWQDALNRKKA
ncbi:MAG: hypothetical protein Q9176_005063 [Flavoplaca citrina]